MTHFYLENYASFFTNYATLNGINTILKEQNFLISLLIKIAYTNQSVVCQKLQSYEPISLLPDLKVVARLLAVGDPLDLGGGGQVQSLAQVREAKRSGYPHICQRQVVDVQQRPQTGQAITIKRKDVRGMWCFLQVLQMTSLAVFRYHISHFWQEIQREARRFDQRYQNCKVPAHTSGS